MLKTNVLIEQLGEEYRPMVQSINIPDFTKCIAQYAGLNIQNVPDDVIKEYLTLWALNKKPIYDMLGGIRVDMPIEYKDENRDFYEQYKEIAIKYPVYGPWLEFFDRYKTNKIDFAGHSNWELRRELERYFPSFHADGTSITHFFKDKLQAPDDLVTSIGRIYENLEVSATFTISIDPVDIMLSSENPYNWSSCYRLENFCESHADGCLAGVIDSATAITYIWNNEGKFSLYGEYDFKNIRYKKVRMTIALNEDFTAIHFNTPYPGKTTYSEDFCKLLREKVETFVANKCNYDNVWKKSEYNPAYATAYREYDQYGYGEYCGDNVYVLKKDEEDYAQFHIYNQIITCPCGCGAQYIGSQNGEEYRYNGDGHINDNYYEERYCDIEGDYVDCDGDCENCEAWRRDNAVCELDEEHYCNDRDLWNAEDEGDFDPYRSNVVHCDPTRCKGCPLYKLHHRNEEEENQ